MSLDLARFRKVCGLLSSTHDGERAVAASMATAMLRAAGMSWTDIGVGGARNYDAEQAAGLFELLLKAERNRTTQMSEEIGRLKREVARLKGMWTKEPA